MKIELSERDKKLLTFLAIFVIVVSVGYWGVIPQLKKASSYKEDIEAQEQLQDVYSQKIGQLVFVESNNDDLEKLISGAKENYYPMMDSDAIDKLITTTVMDKYGLIAYDLTIGSKALANLGPYIYSEKALTGKSDAEQKALEAAAPVISDDGMLLFADVAAADVSTVGIYTVPVSMRLSGATENVEKLLDDLAASKKKLRLVNYSVEASETEIPHEDGTVEIFTEDMLNLSVELYMCME
jgi:Tfp pilus assembly protein PilO